MNSDVLIWSERQAERPAAPHWRGEVVGFLADANSSFSPSMRQGIAAQDLYDRARRQVRPPARTAAIRRALFLTPVPTRSTAC
jgi:hypothetical protein